MIRYVRYASPEDEGPRWGILDRDVVSPIAGTPWIDPACIEAPALALGTLRLLAPVVPTKIVCVGRNYREHAAELGNTVPTEPLLFLKPPSALIGPGDAIELPPQSAQVEHEAELGLVIGRRLRDADESEARRGIFGLTCVNDVTARDLQRADVQFTRAKSFDTFCPVGPALVEGVAFDDLAVRARVDGQLRQDARTRDMIFPPVHLVCFISRVMTLEPGDLIATGTPAGVGPLEAGGWVEVEVEDVGVLGNPVRSRPSTR